MDLQNHQMTRVSLRLDKILLTNDISNKRDGECHIAMLDLMKYGIHHPFCKKYFHSKDK